MKGEAQDFERYARIKPFNERIADTWSAALHDILAAVRKPAAELRVLDYGCGDGKYYRSFVAEGISPRHIHGIDVSQVRVERCRALGWHQAIQLPKGSTLPYPDGWFDLVNLMEVIEHVPRGDIAFVLGDIHRVLAPDGFLLGSTPNYPVKRLYDVYDALVFRKWVRLRDDPTHVSFYSHRRLRRLLAPFFRTVELRCFKTGFLYRRLRQSPFLMHKVLFVCSDKAAR